MKQLIQFLLVAILVMANGMSATAQADSGQRLSREELAVKQAHYIARELALDPSTTDRYVATYCQYQHEVWALGSRKDLRAEQRLARSQQILDLRKKYYAIYSGFLTEPQLDKAYRLEKRLLDRMARNKAQRKDHKDRR